VAEPDPLEMLPSRLHGRILGHLSRLDTYTMKKGRAKEEIVTEFQRDPLYSLFGLDTPEYVGAILAGGTITSIHRKIGDLYEESVRLIIRHMLGLPADLPRFAATITSGDVDEHRTIDAHIPFSEVTPDTRERLQSLAESEVLSITRAPKIEIIAMGFEVRHCYQSADSKRIQADEAMARFLLLSGYPPVMLIFCQQSNRQIIARYTGTWLVKEGMQAYQTLAEMSGFDFYNFLLSNKDEYREIVRKALQRITQ
jgi:hypothetical protein